ncbi:MAG: zinc ribbon domain-containing protein [Acidobacteriota bacterium]|nr:zinc ribbon domain-containing protein [Acidobacteriota bacterium]
MPLYEYRCGTCGKRFEQLRRMQDADRDLECPECKSREVERQLSTFSSSSSGSSGSSGGCGTGGGGRFT